MFAKYSRHLESVTTKLSPCLLMRSCQLNLGLKYVFFSHLSVEFHQIQVLLCNKKQSDVLIFCTSIYAQPSVHFNLHCLFLYLTVVDFGL